MNILFTCAGRRNYLIQYFKTTLAGNGRVLAADMDRFAPALQEADEALLMPGIYDQGYVDELLDIIRSKEINLVISLNDLELKLLSENRERIESAGAKLLVSASQVIDTCFDKYDTVRFLNSIEVNTPKTYISLIESLVAIKNGLISYPLIVKPRFGSASIGLATAHNEEELNMLYALTKISIGRGILATASQDHLDSSVLIQEMLSGIEHGLDVLNDFDGKTRCVYAKKKMGMRAGETEKSQLVDNKTLTNIGSKIGTELAHIGNLDCDIFLDGSEYSVLELNPRFGGGYPFSHCMGADYPKAIVAWARGESFDISEFKRNGKIVVSKCDRLVTMR